MCHRPPPSATAASLSTLALLILSLAHELLRVLGFSVMGVSAHALVALLIIGSTPVSLSLSLSLCLTGLGLGFHGF